MERADAVIIGGGIAGCSTAWHLAKLGLKPVLLEQHRIAAAASGSSAGGVRQQNRDPREMPLSIRSTEKWATLEQDLEADVHYRRGGHLTVAEREADLPRLRANVERQRAQGLELHLLTGDDLRAVIPDVSPNVVAGTYSPSDGHANPILTTQAFARAATRLGASIRQGEPVTRIVADGGRIAGVETAAGRVAADWVVLAAGAWSPGLAEALGLSLPIQTRGPQMMVTEPAPQQLVPVVGAVGRLLSLKQSPGGRYIIGGGWPGDASTERNWATERYASIKGSARDASAIYPPLLKTLGLRVWVGVEAQCQDEVPILGPVDGLSGLLIATGFSGHGFQLGPVVGEIMADLIAKGATPLPIVPLSLRRFEQRSAD